jgi:hypothetical protein
MKNYEDLTQEQVERQDFVDNAIFDLIREVNPTAQELGWDMEVIGDIRDTICTYFEHKLKCFSEMEFYPWLNE